MSAFTSARGVWRTLAPEPVRIAAAPLIRGAANAYVGMTARRFWDARPQEGPIKLVGLLDETHGIAMGARLALKAFEALGAPVEAIGASFKDFAWIEAFQRDPCAGAWIFHLNPPELVGVLGGLGAHRPRGPRFGFWAYELPRAPKRWLADACLVSEIWAPSRYTAAAFEDAVKPRRVVPHPIVLDTYDKVRPLARAADFLAVALFDFNSSAARKNPEGAIEAFHAAFGDDPAARLILKTQNGRAHPQVLTRLLAQAPANVTLVDETWPYERVMALIASADVLISLHRAEGFGMTLAEAMALHTPVVATGWSGNLDFMDETTGLLVPSRPIPVEDPQGIYAGQTWAEPDIAAAATALRRLRDEAGLASRLAQTARRRVETQLSPQAWLAAQHPVVQAVARGLPADAA